MMEFSLSEQTEMPDANGFSVKIIGVGGAGANVLDRMALEGSDDAELLTLNTDVRALSTSVSNNKIQLGKDLMKGMGAGGDPDLGRQAALEAESEIRAAVKGRQMIFVCAGLGGGTGSGATPEVCRIAHEEGVFLVAFTTLPFSFEGKRRMEQARTALAQIGKYANAVVTFENDRMGELVVAKDGIQQAFAAADKTISQSIRATTNIVNQPGIIRIGMDDILAALRNRDSRCLFGYGQAKGDKRATDALDLALKSPLLDRGRLLESASNIIIHVSGGETMTLFEVELLMKELAKHVSDDTQVMFGAATDKKLGGSLSVTILSSLSGADALTGPPPPAKERKPSSRPEPKAQPEPAQTAGESEPQPETVAASPQPEAEPELEPEIAKKPEAASAPEADVVEEKTEVEAEAEADEESETGAPDEEMPGFGDEALKAAGIAGIAADAAVGEAETEAEAEAEVEIEPAGEAGEPEAAVEMETVETVVEASVEVETGPEAETESEIEAGAGEDEPENLDEIEAEIEADVESGEPAGTEVKAEEGFGNLEKILAETKTGDEAGEVESLDAIEDEATPETEEVVEAPESAEEELVEPVASVPAEEPSAGEVDTPDNAAPPSPVSPFEVVDLEDDDEARAEAGAEGKIAAEAEDGSPAEPEAESTAEEVEDLDDDDLAPPPWMLSPKPSSEEAGAESAPSGEEANDKSKGGKSGSALPWIDSVIPMVRTGKVTAQGEGSKGAPATRKDKTSESKPQPESKLESASGPATEGDAGATGPVKAALSIRDLARKSRETPQASAEEPIVKAPPRDEEDRVTISKDAREGGLPTIKLTQSGISRPQPEPEEAPAPAPASVVEPPALEAREKAAEAETVAPEAVSIPESKESPVADDDDDDWPAESSLPTLPEVEDAKPAGPASSPMPVPMAPPKSPEPAVAGVAASAAATTSIPLGGAPGKKDTGKQALLELEPLSKGRFAKTEPTIVDGQDMDVPTFLRQRKGS